ncbi:hypothetical protein [Aquirhabdus sp.]|uniref:hypothetical protein n=1 Tax=Aquirhabdus sp. TaxID=2824160 RepID=UPI00396CE340
MIAKIIQLLALCIGFFITVSLILYCSSDLRRGVEFGSGFVLMVGLLTLVLSPLFWMYVEGRGE